MSKKVSILGCGWLGLPLGRALSQSPYNYTVKGSTTRSEKLELLSNNGIKPFQFLLTPQGTRGEQIKHFFNASTLVVDFPPERRPDIDSYLPNQVEKLIDHIAQSPVKNVLFVSSTSVYPSLCREVKEHDAGNAARKTGRALLKAERMLQNAPSFNTTVLRFCGLIGPNRFPGRFLAGKQNLSNGSAPVNLIHRADCLSIMITIIEQDIWNKTFNACADQHPLRQDFYTAAAEMAELPPPSFKEEDTASYKIVNSDKLKEQLNYTFTYPDPFDFLKEWKEEKRQHKE